MERLEHLIDFNLLNQINAWNLLKVLFGIVVLPVGKAAYVSIKYYIYKNLYYRGFKKVHPQLKTPAFLRLQGKDGDVEEVIKEMYNEQLGHYEDIAHQGCHIGGDNIVSISDPESIKIVLNNENIFVKDKSYEVLSITLGQGLVTSKGDLWKKQRKILTPAFHFDYLKGLIPLMAKHLRVQMKEWEDSPGQYFDVYLSLKKLTLPVITSALMGNKVNHEDIGNHFSSILYNFNILFLFYLLLGRLVRFLPVPAIQTVYRDNAKLRKVIGDEVKRRLSLKGSQENNNDIVDLMVKANCSEEQIIDETITLLFAGHDTTSSVLSSCFYFLNKYPQYYDRIHEEIDENEFDLTEGNYGAEVLEKMNFTKCFIKEVMRLYTPIVFLDRKCTQDFVLSNTLIPKGTVVDLMFANVHRDPRFWENPEEFNPDRFAQHDASRHPYAYLPFSAAARSCIGQKFAMYQMILILASVVKKFRVVPHPNTPSELKMNTETGITHVRFDAQFQRRD